MADQQRWFKLWCSVLTDDGLQSLPPALRWAWAALGCYMKLNGTRGTAEISTNNHALAGALGVTAGALQQTISLLPHVHVEEGKRDNGTFTVTFENWRKYQEDSTVAERVARLRSKRRGEEKREEEKRIPSVSPHRGDAHRVLDFLNEKAGKHFRRSAPNVDPIIARLKGGISLEDLRSIVAMKSRDWGPDAKMAPYLRPATLFNATKCEQYLGELHGS